jgi:long-chain acyl-CoA synthetase
VTTISEQDFYRMRVPHKLIEEEVNKINDQLARVENIRQFRILDKKLHTEDGEVTPTMKVKRKSINAQYEDLIESIYRE